MSAKTDVTVERAARPGPKESHSTRSLEVLVRASRGRTHGEIAARRNLAIHEVKRHLASIYHELGVSNRTAAVSSNLREMSNALVQREG